LNGRDVKDYAAQNRDFYRATDIETQISVWLAPGQMEIFRLP
jgi:hypothetical protein